MPVNAHVLNKDQIIVYPVGKKSATPLDKDTVLRDLCAHIAYNWKAVDVRTVESLVARRESAISTRINQYIAIPHAIIPDVTENRIAVAVVPQGVLWDSADTSPVHLVVLLAGGRENHLKMLSKVAMILQDETLVQKLMTAESPEEFISFLRREESSVTGVADPDLSRKVFRAALRLSDSIESSRIVLHADAIDDDAFIADLVGDKDVLVVAGGDRQFSNEYFQNHEPVILPFRGVKRSAHVQFTLLYLLGRGIIDQSDIVINVFGNPGSGVFDSIRLMHLDRELNMKVAGKAEAFPPDLDLSIFTRVLQIATQLALEGREGKPVGTLFVVGDFPGVLPYCRQMIVNPFHGYPREERNILDPSIEETVKEFARIDGAFIINGDGTIESAGTYLSAAPESEEMQSGLGARHAAAMGITVVSSALSVAISESTRKISVYQSGRRIMEL